VLEADFAAGHTADAKGRGAAGDAIAKPQRRGAIRTRRLHAPLNPIACQPAKALADAGRPDKTVFEYFAAAPAIGNEMIVEALFGPVEPVIAKPVHPKPRSRQANVARAGGSPLLRMVCNSGRFFLLCARRVGRRCKAGNPVEKERPG